MIKSPNPMDDKIFGPPPKKNEKFKPSFEPLSSWDNGVHEILEFA
jgi:hypothetical protein